jgi:hypothetical protein
MQEESKHNWFLILISLSCLAVIASAFYFFYFKKDYEFVVEVSCDITQETCFQRDCTNPDDCPPNGLSDFKRYTLNAGDFQKCENGDCKIACEAGTIKCEPVECSEDLDVGESCSTLSGDSTLQ